MVISKRNFASGKRRADALREGKPKMPDSDRKSTPKSRELSWADHDASGMGEAELPGEVPQIAENVLDLSAAAGSRPLTATPADERLGEQSWQGKLM